MAQRTRYALLATVVVIIALGFAGYEFAGPIRNWIHPSQGPQVLLVSGNIEAHESALSFKTVQSRIVELPFDEGQSVASGQLIARVESADYCQQVTIAETALETQNRQLDISRNNVDAAKKIVTSDEADLELKQLDYDRAARLLTSGAGTVETRDQTLTAMR